MTDNTMWPFWLLALILHGALAVVFWGNTQQAPIELTGEGGTGIEVGLDQSAYQTLMRQQAKATLQKAAKARAIKQAKTPKPIKTKQHKPKQLIKPTKVDTKPIVKPITKPAIKSVAATPAAKAQAMQKVAMVSPTQTQLTASPITQTDTTNGDTAQPSASVITTTTSDTQHAQSTVAATSNNATEKAMGTPAPLVMDDATKRYIRTLMRHISQFKEYPSALKKAHIEGTPIIRFTFNKDGEVLETTIKKRSSHQTLDQAAIEVFKKANPLPPIPTALKRDTLTMSLPIKFNLIND